MKADSLSVPRHREEESLSIYPYTYPQMWFQGSVDCPSPAARGGTKEGTRQKKGKFPHKASKDRDLRYDNES